MVFCACEHDIVRKTDFNVTLDEHNTYFTGEPVRFNFSGEVDNVIFYSGETGSEYKYKDRYTVPFEDVKSVNLGMQFQARYGAADAMEIWISNSFDGLNGEDGEADRATIKAMVEADMQGWTRLDYQEGASTKWTEQQFNLSDYKESFSIAFHWCPKDITKTQRTYWINGSLSFDLENMDPTSMDISELGFKTVMMNEEIEDPYHQNAGNGSIVLNTPKTASLVFQGVGANELPYAIDGWAISTPTPLNRVANDKSVVIKNLQNYMNSYEYVWKESGTYVVTFVGTNSNYKDATVEVHEMTINIIDKF